MRPFWLLRKPIVLRGELARILAGPERIESGWWDEHDKRRDYYVVETHQGQRAWAFVPADSEPLDAARLVRMKPIKPRKPRRLRAPIEPGLANGEEEDPRSALYKHAGVSNEAARLAAKQYGRGTHREEMHANDAEAIRANTTPCRYAELHCLSNFSFQRGASSARELFERAKRLRLFRAGDHRRMLAGRHRARAGSVEGNRHQTHRRHRSAAGRRPEARVAREPIRTVIPTSAV